jgi:hypothetical protein
MIDTSVVSTADLEKFRALDNWPKPRVTVWQDAGHQQGIGCVTIYGVRDLPWRRR